MKILVIGNGDIGSSLFTKFKKNYKHEVNICSHNNFEEYIKKLKPEVIINCCGIFEFSSIGEIAWEHKFDTIFDANVKFAYRVANTFYDVKKATIGYKCLLNIGSISAEEPHANSIFYCASKAALEMMTKCLAKALGAQGFIIAQLNPGMVRDTNMVEGILKVFPQDTSSFITQNHISEFVDQLISFKTLVNGKIYDI